MDKLEKVIKGFDVCKNLDGCCDGCPYFKDEINFGEDDCMRGQLMIDALELLKEQRWIPLTERLPKEKETVLLSDGYDVLYGYITTKRDFILVDEALSKDNFLIKSKQHWGISHWMPLPKIPKDGEQE